MVPRSNSSEIKYISSLKTLLNIFIKLEAIADHKKNFILSQNWKELHDYALVQEKINILLDRALIDVDFFKNKESGNEIKKLKNQIYKAVKEYRYKEYLNAKLLKDALFVSRKKAQKFFNIDNQNETYSRNIKNTSDLWGNKPLLHDRLA